MPPPRAPPAGRHPARSFNTRGPSIRGIRHETRREAKTITRKVTPTRSSASSGTTKGNGTRGSKASPPGPAPYTRAPPYNAAPPAPTPTRPPPVQRAPARPDPDEPPAAGGDRVLPEEEGRRLPAARTACNDRRELHLPVQACGVRGEGETRGQDHEDEGEFHAEEAQHVPSGGIPARGGPLLLVHPNGPGAPEDGCLLRRPPVSFGIQVDEERRSGTRAGGRPGGEDRGG